MEARLPTQVYAIGNGILLLVLMLALFMMSKAALLDPSDFRTGSSEQQLDRAAGLDAFGASGLPELRIWWTSAAITPAEASGVIVTPAAISRYTLSEDAGWGRRYDVTHSASVTTPATRDIFRLMQDLSTSDGHYLFCGSNGATIWVRGVVDGRAFSFRQTGACGEEGSPRLTRLIEVVSAAAPKIGD